MRNSNERISHGREKSAMDFDRFGLRGNYDGAEASVSSVSNWTFDERLGGWSRSGTSQSSFRG
jgi:hypothetical protein